MSAAKTASEEKKPDGYFEIRTREDYVDLITDRDVRVLFGVGAKTAERLRELGIRKVRDIRENQDTVIRTLGKMGEWAVDLAFGNDTRRVIPYHAEDAKSVSRELTFQEDVEDFSLLEDVLPIRLFLHF